ncbi:MAG: VOC family protein [Streptosporangiaceae bacterium]
MPGQIPAGEIHHLRLTVTGVQRSREFYTSLLGFQVAVDSPPPGDPGADEAFSILFGGTARSPAWSRSASTCCPSTTLTVSSWSSPRR